MVFKILRHLKGVIRTPTLYDIAVSQEEIMWFIGELEKGDCSIIEKDVNEMHFYYMFTIETNKMRMNRSQIIHTT